MDGEGGMSGAEGGAVGRERRRNTHRRPAPRLLLSRLQALVPHIAVHTPGHACDGCRVIMMVPPLVALADPELLGSAGCSSPFRTLFPCMTCPRCACVDATQSVLPAVRTLRAVAVEPGWGGRGTAGHRAAAAMVTERGPTARTGETRGCDSGGASSDPRRPLWWEWWWWSGLSKEGAMLDVAKRWWVCLAWWHVSVAHSGGADLTAARRGGVRAGGGGTATGREGGAEAAER